MLVSLGAPLRAARNCDGARQLARGGHHRLWIQQGAERDRTLRRTRLAAASGRTAPASTAARAAGARATRARTTAPAASRCAGCTARSRSRLSARPGPPAVTSSAGDARRPARLSSGATAAAARAAGAAARGSSAATAAAAPTAAARRGATATAAARRSRAASSARPAGRAAAFTCCLAGRPARRCTARRAAVPATASAAAGAHGEAQHRDHHGRLRGSCRHDFASAVVGSPDTGSKKASTAFRRRSSRSARSATRSPATARRSPRTPRPGSCLPRSRRA